MHIVNADYARRSAEAVLAVNLSDVELTRVSQFAIGWMRAAFEQSRVIADLTAAGKAHLATPNRRMFWEIALRLTWLANIPAAERDGAANAMLARNRSDTAMTDTHMRDMGHETDIDIAEMDAFFLDLPDSDSLKKQAKNLTEAVRGHAEEGLNTAFIYRLWREDSMYTHATGFLAGHYAPAGRGTVETGTPPVIDPDLEAHRLVAMLIVFTSGFLLNDEGVPSELSSACTVAFHGVK